MEKFAQLLTAIAALVGSLAWPITILVLVFIFRAELRSVFIKIPIFLDRVKRASLAGVALELDRVANAEAKNSSDKGGQITPRQIESAERIKIQDVSPVVLLNELDRLCLEYEAIRRTFPSGSERTRAMTKIIVKMRSLTPSLVDFIDVYKGSGSAGSRLAAIAMMQMVPRVADLNWLQERFSADQPFAFYHAALALQNFADSAITPEQREQLRQVARQALETVKNFDGVPDRGTTEVLESLLSSLPRGK